MRRLPGILLATGTILIVVVALLISGLRLVLPELDRYRSQLLEKVQAISGVPVEADFVQGSWETFGPTLEVRNIRLTLPQSSLQIERVTLALDVWQSLLHWRWRFRDLTFYQLQLDLNTQLTSSDENSNGLQPGRVSDLFLYQLDHFVLRDSRVSFLAPSGSPVQFHIPQLTWLNNNNHHRAEGQLSLSTLNGQHGELQLRLDLRDEQGLLNTGTIYLQADDIDMKPWFSRWLKTNTGLESANFSLAAWLHLKSGQIRSGDALLKQGTASWLAGSDRHQLAVDNLALMLSSQDNGWQLHVPELKLKTDGQAWPPGAFTALWLPERRQFIGSNQQEELRIRASNIQLERLEGLLPAFSFLSPTLMSYWQHLQPQGKLPALALDIPLQQPEKIRFQAWWQDLNWQPWQGLPGGYHFSGELQGSTEHARLTLALNNSTLPYGDMFRAPLLISRARGSLTWQHSDQGWELAGQGLDVQAKSLWANGDFSYQQPVKGEPWLAILAGIRLYDGADAWRYFPEPLMGKHLVDYLSAAIQGGQVDNASLIYAGNPQHFPYRQNEGHFQVSVPLRHATFQFQPDWPALHDLAIDLDFSNHGLWMQAPQTLLGNVVGSNISAVIPDYLMERLVIDAEVAGTGQAIHDYFLQTPLDDSVGAALDELQVGGNVSGRLHLDIPLNGEQVIAKGEVTLNNNALLINPLGSQLEQVSGKFRFNNGNLESDTLAANWFGQPLAVNFTTEDGAHNYKVNVVMKGDWQLAKVDGLSPELAKSLAGNAGWQGKVAINLPHHKGQPSYDIDVNADLKKVSSHLPAPLRKAAGEALPVSINVNGSLNGFMLKGSVGKQNHFNSEWLLSKQQVNLTRAVWDDNTTVTPALPEDKSLVLNLPIVDGEPWLALLAQAKKQHSGADNMGSFNFPTTLIMNTSQLLLGGQQWRDIHLAVEQQLAGVMVVAKGKELDGRLSMPDNGPWHADLAYLYYNPQFSNDNNGTGPSNPFATSEQISFRGLPSLILRCKSCWFRGQNLGMVEADIKHLDDALVLEHGMVDTGYGRMSVTGLWKQSSQEERTALKGKLQGSKIDQTAGFFGITIPLKDAPYNIDFDLHWHGQPWKPQFNTLNGMLDIDLGKGLSDVIEPGRAGQLLRLVSFDALLRKLRFDFSDIFGSGFYFDSIRGTARAKNGIMHTDNLLIDGLSADIGMSGYIDLVNRKIAMQAVIAPEISATVGVATAFVINPIVGVAVFAASKVFGPLWSKISFIRYDITGSLDQPSINEVLRKPREEKAQ